MMEVFKLPAAPGQWLDFYQGKAVDWDQVFEGFGATVDWPSTSAWRELAAHYPQAKLVLTTRDTEGWYKSVQDTIYRDFDFTGAPEPWRSMALAMTRFTFGEPRPDKAKMIATYEAHNALVRKTFGPDRLLDFQVRQGWGPLCEFLGVPAPETDFPRVNSTDEFKAMRGARPKP